MLWWPRGLRRRRIRKPKVEQISAGGLIPLIVNPATHPLQCGRYILSRDSRLDWKENPFRKQKGLDNCLSFLPRELLRLSVIVVTRERKICIKTLLGLKTRVNLVPPSLSSRLKAPSFSFIFPPSVL